MSTRRTFLKMNLAVVGASVLSPLGASSAEVQSRSVDFFVFDQTIPDANSRAQQTSGLIALPAGRDLYPIWRDSLRDQLAASPKTVAGITSGEAAFCLAEAAKDYGYSIIQSDVFQPRAVFAPTRVRMTSLTPIELNRPVTVEWVMARTGASFHGGSAMI